MRDAFEGDDPLAPDDVRLISYVRSSPQVAFKAIDTAMDRWVAMSALQKAVRFDDVSVAVAASNALLCAGETAAIWRRIRIIAVEDVGIGDPYVMAFVLWLVRQRELRDELGDQRIVNIALSLMCSATKSRDMADVAFWGTLPASIDVTMHQYGATPSDELIKYARDSSLSMAARYAASRALFPARHPKVKYRRRPHQSDRLELYRAHGMPSVLQYAIENDIAFGGDALTSAACVVWARLSASTQVDARPDLMGDAPSLMIGGVPAATYDRYTRIGRWVLAKLLREHQPWKTFFSHFSAAQPLQCVMRALFYIEGGKLHPRLNYEGAADLYWSVLEAKFASTGIPSMDQGGWELLSLTREALPQIISLRARAVLG
jgi:hypothetical protein